MSRYIKARWSFPPRALVPSCPDARMDYVSQKPLRRGRNQGGRLEGVATPARGHHLGGVQPRPGAACFFPSSKTPEATSALCPDPLEPRFPGNTNELRGLALNPVTEEAKYFDTRPTLWAEAESLLEPWANVTLTCQSPLWTLEFQLFKDGVAQGLVHLDSPATEYRFPLGAVTGDTRGLYRCHYSMDSGRSSLSNLVEVTGAEPLPPPLLSTKPVPWITPGLNTRLLCLGGLRGVTFLLRREGDDKFLEVAEAPKDRQATFPVHRAGIYSCSYRTHASGAPSEPSATVTIEELATPPPPTLTLNGGFAGLLRPGSSATLTCVAPLSGVQFQLRRGEDVLQVPMASTSPDRLFFQLNTLAPGDGGVYTCRYRLPEELALWSLDSAPAELVLSDGTLPAPELSAEPATLSPEPGTLVQLRCRAPRAGVRFSLVREGAGQRRVHGLLSPAGTEAHFELRDVSAVDSANYSCVYTDTAPPFAGSAPSAPVELRVDGPLPKPRLRALWTGAVTPGRDAVLRCEGHVPDVSFLLLRSGEEEPSAVAWTTDPSADLVLTYVGPQHAGNYSCGYRSNWPHSLLSQLSDPVELQVAGS
ncbi:alpha-1B-glycoprotein isoform X4 [Globicephala melas]|uniref:alpha-1B-glycoprotein isoform X4 n=1 Tax=Globicephala melas TaxID=9731 RepID=UPI00293D3CE1|nr:alpha-1B-glycoprotein isoform X4 [Globicephala melas]